MKTKIIITSMICSLFFGCATHGLTHQQLIDTQKLLLKSKDKNKLIAFYRNHLDEESQFKVELIKIYLEQKDLESAKIY
ncbi:hypothetical protein L1D34_30780, partial [Vibrio mediterranei]|nr:hypothetical protein [Vibrio mediterranei]